MNSLQIVTKLSEQFDKFEGPIYANILIPNKLLEEHLQRNGPVLILLADIHDTNKKCFEKCTKEKKCYSLYTPSTFIEYINDFSKENSIKSDLFLEIWLNESINFKHRDEYKSSLAELIDSDDIKSCIKKNNCIYPNIRIHMSDTRNIFINKYKNKNKYLGDSVIFLTLSCLNQNKKYIENIKKTFKIIFPDFKPNDIILVVKRAILNYENYFNEPFVKKYSRTYHEWIQLPENIRNILNNNSKLIYKNDLNISINKLNNIFDLLLDDKEINNNDLTKICLSSIIRIFIIDIYTVSRLLKSSLSSDLSIIYLGAFHIENIIKLLKSYYQSVETYGTSYYETIELFGYNKCISKNNNKDCIIL